MTVSHERWAEQHSVTCAICGGLADERRTVNLVANLPDERPSLIEENPSWAITIMTAVNEYGEGEAHEDCVRRLETHLLMHGARLAEEFILPAVDRR